MCSLNVSRSDVETHMQPGDMRDCASSRADMQHKEPCVLVDDVSHRFIMTVPNALTNGIVIATFQG